MGHYFTTFQRRLLNLSRKRTFTDTVCWLILYLLIIGFTTIDLWKRYEKQEDCKNFTAFVVEKDCNEAVWLDAFLEIISTSTLFLLILMICGFYPLM